MKVDITGCFDMYLWPYLVSVNSFDFKYPCIFDLFHAQADYHKGSSMKLQIKHFCAYFRTGSFTSSARFVNNALLSPKESSERGTQKKLTQLCRVSVNLSSLVSMANEPFQRERFATWLHESPSGGARLPEALLPFSLVLFLEDFLTLCA